MTTAVKRACDACHRRKVKCDGINPCRNCHSAQLSCTYNAIPQKKGPKGSRAKVISELRETQRQTNLASKVHNRLNGAASPPASPRLSPTPGLMTKEIVRECVEFYFANMYPIIPILNRQQLDMDLAGLETNLDTYCLVTALSAFMMLQPGMSMPGGPGGDPYCLDSMPGANLVSGTLLLDETVRVRKAFDPLDAPTLNGICTSYLLFACYYAVELHDKAWYHLREATTVAHMIGMNNEESYMSLDIATASRRRRLYWLLFVTERAYALQRGRPLTLQDTINPPTSGDDPNDPLSLQLNGFVLLVNLFRPFDDQLVKLWNKAKGNSSSYIGALQKQLSEVLPAYMNVGDSLADARTNQTWLKNMAWQFGMSNSLNSDPNMAQFPMDMSRDLIAMTSTFSPQNMELIHGGFVEKLFDVSSSLVDALAFQPAVRNPLALFNPHESLQQVLNMIGLVRSGETRFLPLLLSKMTDMIPRLVNPMLQNAPESAAAAYSVDIFDGFGNAGMMPMDDYDRKFQVAPPPPRMDDFKSEPGSSSASAPSVADMNSPFVSSPAVLSPGVEFPHHPGLPSDFSSMTDMVMSPVGGPAPGQGGGPPPQMNPSGHHHHHQQQHSPQPPQSQQQPHQHQHNPHQHQHPHHPPQQQPPIPPSLQGMSHGMGGPFQTGLMSGMGQPQPGLGIPGQQSFNPLGLSRPQQQQQQPPPQQQQQRTNTFGMQGPPPQLRTVADFQALQQRTAGTDLGMGGMVPELDFNTLPSTLPR